MVTLAGFQLAYAMYVQTYNRRSLLTQYMLMFRIMACHQAIRQYFVDQLHNNFNKPKLGQLVPDDCREIEVARLAAPFCA